MRPGAERRPVRGAAGPDRRPVHPEAHQEAERHPRRSHPGARRRQAGAAAQDLLLRLRLPDPGRRLPTGNQILIIWV